MTISLNGQRRCPLGTTLRQLLPLPCLIMFCVVLGCHLANKAQSFRVICFSDSADDYVNELQGRLRKTFYLVRRYLGKTATRRKEQSDVKVNPTTLPKEIGYGTFVPGSMQVCRQNGRNGIAVLI